MSLYAANYELSLYKEKAGWLTFHLELYPTLPILARRSHDEADHGS